MSGERGTFKIDVAESLRAIAAPIFAASESEHTNGTVLTVHVAAVSQRSEVKRRILAAFSDAPLAKIKVRFHRASVLLAPRSLERLVARFADGVVVYDPTGSITRAKTLVQAARATREALGPKLRGLYYAPRLRTMFVALDAKRVAAGDKVKVGALAEIERAVLISLTRAFGAQVAECPAVRVGFGLPNAELVAVDQRSVAGWGARAVSVARRYWKPIAVAALFGFGANAAHAAGPAVSTPNLKLTGAGGSTDGETTWVAGGAFTAPLGNSFGVQIEAGGGGIDDDMLWGAGAHLFTRDPDSYLLGLFAVYGEADEFDIDATRLGAEAEIYLNQVSILVAAGYQFSDTLEDTAFGDVELRWYVSNNFALSAGGRFDENTAAGRIGAEWQPGFSALPGLAFRVDGIFGEDDFDSIMGGITYYFGTDASLKDRHRKQDPAPALFQLFQAVQQEQTRLCALYGGCP